jgi:CspA family cold shock protein
MMAARRRDPNHEPEAQDETRYCERCGISFLYSAEEQAQPQKAPALCPGCRTLLPPGDRERGIVKWYNRCKKYGFITRVDNNELFAHRSQLRGFGTLHEGDLVEFAIGEGERGPMAMDIRILERAADTDVETQ